MKTPIQKKAEGEKKSNLIRHAEYELKMAGLFDKDSDYDGMLGTAVIELITVFSKQGHSGMSASMARTLFSKLSNFENLTPITDNREEWMAVGEQNGNELSQSRRKSTLFSEDGGKTYYDIDEVDRPLHKSKMI